jgi:hypothetical protein
MLDTMNKLFLRLLGCLFIVSSLQAQGEAPGSNFRFHTPESWRGEIIKLPPGFARDLKWHGIESIKFAPGMFKADSDSFFSYVLVFQLSKDDDVSESAVHAQILTYYKGLANAVMGGKNIPVNTDDFSLKLTKSENGETPGAVPADAKGKEVSTWNGTLDWTEPFATQKPQTLNLEVHLWKTDGRPVLYFTVSPQGKDHKIWEEMRGYRGKFKIDSSAGHVAPD